MEKKLAAAIVPLFAAALLAMAAATPARAGVVPVFDSGSIAQEVLILGEAYKQVQTLMDQLKNMEKQLTELKAQTTELQAQTPELKTQTALDKQNTELQLNYSWDWDAAHEGIFEKLRDITGAVKELNTTAEDMDAYLEKTYTGDVDYYSKSKCLTGEGECSDKEWGDLRERQVEGIKSQKEANNALFKALSKQMKSIEDDTQQLDDIQGKATNAQGQMEALSYANQLAALQTKQLMQLRSLMVVQQEAFAVMMANNNDKAAREIVSDKKMTGTEMKYEAPKKTGWVWSDDGALRRN